MPARRAPDHRKSPAKTYPCTPSPGIAFVFPIPPGDRKGRPQSRPRVILSERSESKDFTARVSDRSDLSTLALSPLHVLADLCDTREVCVAISLWIKGGAPKGQRDRKAKTPSIPHRFAEPPFRKGANATRVVKCYLFWKRSPCDAILASYATRGLIRRSPGGDHPGKTPPRRTPPGRGC